MIKQICPHCQGSGFEPADLESQLRTECGRRGINILFPDLICERDAAQLLGYSGGDTLRKQVYEGRHRINFVLRGNQRKYSLSDIAHYLEIEE